MYVRVVLAALSLALIGATKTATRLGPGVLYPQVVQVVCDQGKGTAFRVPGHMVSVAHVTTLTGCTINGQPFAATSDPGLDFSTGPSRKGGIPINCGGFKSGTYVFAVGYARGYQWQTMVRLFVAERAKDGKQLLVGPPTVIPGMSGGPVLNADGEVVGTVNAYFIGSSISLSQPLQGTSLCSAS